VVCWPLPIGCALSPSILYVPRLNFIYVLRLKFTPRCFGQYNECPCFLLLAVINGRRCTSHCFGFVRTIFWPVFGSHTSICMASCTSMPFTKISEDLACHYFVPWPKYRKHINSTIVVIRYPQFPRIYTLYTSYQLCFITMPPKKISAAAAKASTNTPWAMLGFICLHVLLTDMSSDALEAVLCLKR